ncbi:hypothetical protein [Gallaecimonas sp. GXIMD4217]|uniref:hypothetical protein n=1 Tax=Gallaecimonas sp. GXIMD4217 TaxID=3131927 RepID=UPI00311B2ECD
MKTLTLVTVMALAAFSNQTTAEPAPGAAATSHQHYVVTLKSTPFSGWITRTVNETRMELNYEIALDVKQGADAVIADASDLRRLAKAATNGGDLSG